VFDDRRAVAPQHNRPTPSAPPYKLARKAGTIHNREILGCRLREVAYRTAIRARQSRARSTPRMEIQEMEESHSGPQTAASRSELRLLLRAEVEGLPAKYRLPVLHTFMEGKSNEPVTRLLGCPVGTVKGRLAPSSPARALARMSNNSGPASTAIRSRSAVDQTRWPLAGKVVTLSSRLDSHIKEPSIVSMT
jgi:hypothetical protein